MTPRVKFSLMIFDDLVNFPTPGESTELFVVAQYSVVLWIHLQLTLPLKKTEFRFNHRRDNL